TERDGGRPLEHVRWRACRMGLGIGRLPQDCPRRARAGHKASLMDGIPPALRPEPRRAARAAASDASGPKSASAPSRSNWLAAAVLGSLLCAALELPFLHKPYHIDDYLFVRVARAVLHYPLAPYSGPDLFTGAVRELYVHNNPPLVPALLAAILGRFGESLVALHLGLLPFTLLAVFAFARI